MIRTKMQQTLKQMSIGSVFLIDPTLKPTMAKPQDEDYTDAKILFYFPESQDIHERRK